MLSYALFLLLAAQDCLFRVAAQDAGPPRQVIAASPKAPGTFSNGAPIVNGRTATEGDPPDAYGAREIDIPFYRLYHGHVNFFSAGQMNNPTDITDHWGSQYDNANQSACGIPDNAFWNSKVAIHPYFLKYADLSRKYKSSTFSSGTAYEY